MAACGNNNQNIKNETNKEENGMLYKDNKEKALALIGSFASGDTSVADEVLADGYIQHNLAYGTGKAAFISAVEGLKATGVPTTVKNVRAFTDGDYVFLQNLYNFAGAGDQVAFDVFRFENGKIAEHWDNLDAVAAPNPSGHTQTDGATEIKDLDKTEENKKIVLGFVEDVLMGKNMEALTSYYDGNNYIQHNTGIADGLDGLGSALATMAEQGIAMVYDETHLLLGEGNFVLAASQGTLGGTPVTYYDLFRVENGKIAEHWDIIENLTEETTWANNNGKFGNDA
ncbi:MAG: nuclear transport factor 2 family protein, partial [Clostridia bacterium]|nr:nuclear transport factor 2 family protein [Clostridia bacterium]